MLLCMGLKISDEASSRLLKHRHYMTQDKDTWLWWLVVAMQWFARGAVADCPSARCPGAGSPRLAAACDSVTLCHTAHVSRVTRRHGRGCHAWPNIAMAPAEITITRYQQHSPSPTSINTVYRGSRQHFFQEQGICISNQQHQSDLTSARCHIS